MSKPSDPNALLVFFLGGSNADVYIDNVSISEVTQSDVTEFAEGQAPTDFELLPACPNPFNAGTSISFNLPKVSHVTLTVYNLLGERVLELLNAPQDAGHHQVKVNAANLISGVYFYEMKAYAVNSANTFQAVNKIMLVK